MGDEAADEKSRKRGSGSKTVYDRLRKDILELELRPGSPLDENTLSVQFSMSRTPIREALVRLAAEGLVTTLPNRNTIVSVVDLEHMRAYFDALLLMYRVTTRGAALCCNDAHLGIIRDKQADFVHAARNQDALSMIDTNREFHLAIAWAAGNPYYTEFFERLLDHGRRILRLYYRSYEDRLPVEIVEEHEEMVEALETRDADRADRLASRHAERIVRQLQKLVEPELSKTLAL